MAAAGGRGGGQRGILTSAHCHPLFHVPSRDHTARCDLLSALKAE
jgi:hypothetical protein